MLLPFHNRSISHTSRARTAFISAAGGNSDVGRRPCDGRRSCVGAAVAADAGMPLARALLGEVAVTTERRT